MNKIVQQTIVSPAKLDEDSQQQQQTIAPTEQTTQMVDDIRK
jgi:hypothetical protein